MRFNIFDDAPEQYDTRWAADDFADALRTPLAAIGVSVVRRHGSGKTEFQAKGISAKTYKTKYKEVSNIVETILSTQASQETTTRST